MYTRDCLFIDALNRCDHSVSRRAMEDHDNTDKSRPLWRGGAGWQPDDGAI